MSTCLDHLLAGSKPARETHLMPKEVIFQWQYLYPTFISLSSFNFSILLFPQVESATTKVLHVLNLAEELPEENFGTDLSARLNGDILHIQIIRAQFEKFQLESLVYCPDLAVACSNMTLEQRKYTTLLPCLRSVLNVS